MGAEERPKPQEEGIEVALGLFGLLCGKDHVHPVPPPFGGASKVESGLQASMPPRHAVHFGGGIKRIEGWG